MPVLRLYNTTRTGTDCGVHSYSASANPDILQKVRGRYVINK